MSFEVNVTVLNKTNSIIFSLERMETWAKVCSLSLASRRHHLFPSRARLVKSIALLALPPTQIAYAQNAA